MSKIRINDLARELEVKSKEILDVLTTVGVTEKKTHSSSLEDHEAELVRKHLRGRSEGAPSSAKTSRAAHGDEGIKTKIDLSNISRPGDVLRAITQQKGVAEHPVARPAVKPTVEKPAVEAKAGAPKAVPPKPVIDAPAPPAPAPAVHPPVTVVSQYTAPGAPRELRRTAEAQPHDVVKHQDLAVTLRAGADADGGDRQFFRDQRGQLAGNRFEDNGESARRGDGLRVAEQLLGGLHALALHLESAQQVL